MPSTRDKRLGLSLPSPTGLALLHVPDADALAEVYVSLTALAALPIDGAWRSDAGSYEDTWPSFRFGWTAEEIKMAGATDATGAALSVKQVEAALAMLTMTGKVVPTIFQNEARYLPRVDLAAPDAPAPELYRIEYYCGAFFTGGRPIDLTLRERAVVCEVYVQGGMGRKTLAELQNVFRGKSFGRWAFNIRKRLIKQHGFPPDVAARTCYADGTKALVLNANPDSQNGNQNSK
jgi:hypothetical protein